MYSSEDEYTPASMARLEYLPVDAPEQQSGECTGRCAMPRDAQATLVSNFDAHLTSIELRLWK